MNREETKILRIKVGTTYVSLTTFISDYLSACSQLQNYQIERCQLRRDLEKKIIFDKFLNARDKLATPTLVTFLQKWSLSPPRRSLGSCLTYLFPTVFY